MTGASSWAARTAVEEDATPRRTSYSRRILYAIAAYAAIAWWMPSAVTAQNDSELTGRQRVEWVVKSTIGPRSLGAGVVSAGWGTALNNPEERGPHWGGFAERYGMRLSGVATGNAIEAGLGAIWHEDPRYLHASNSGALERIRHAAFMTVAAPRADGTVRPAYARFAGIAGNNFLSNTWRLPSESSAADALTRTATGFAGRFVSNLFDEFWPELMKKLGRNNED